MPLPTPVRIVVPGGADGATPTELPFVTGVLADLTGHAAPPPAAFRVVDAAGLDACMTQLQPRLDLNLPDLVSGTPGLKLQIHFHRFSDFDPQAVLQQITPLVGLQADRARILDLSDALDGQYAAQDAVAGLLADHRQGLADGVLDAFLAGDGARLLRARSHDSLIQALAALARQVQRLGAAVGDDLVGYMIGLGATLEEWAHAQLHLVLSHPDFVQLESAWHGLHHLVAQPPDDPMLPLQVLSCTPAQLQRALQPNALNDDAGDAHAAALAQALKQGPLDAPWGCLVCDLALGPQDLPLLAALAHWGAQAHAPVLVPASPAWAGLGNWAELSPGTPLPAAGPMPAAWPALRASPEARFLMLLAPRFLARARHGPDTALGAYNFTLQPERPPGQVWVSAPWLMASHARQSFAQHRWLAQLAGPQATGPTDQLPHEVSKDPHGALSARFVEGGLTPAQEAGLLQLGLQPLSALPTGAVFRQARSIHRAAPDPGQPADDAAADVASLLCCCRFVHGVRSMVHSSALADAAALQSTLTAWLASQCKSSEALRAEGHWQGHRWPLGHAAVRVHQGQPGSTHLDVELELQPRYQLGSASAIQRFMVKLAKPLHRP